MWLVYMVKSRHWWNSYPHPPRTSLYLVFISEELSILTVADIDHLDFAYSLYISIYPGYGWVMIYTPRLQNQLFFTNGHPVAQRFLIC